MDVYPNNQVNRARFLVACLTGLLAINLVVVGVASWMNLSPSAAARETSVRLLPTTAAANHADIASAQVTTRPPPTGRQTEEKVDASLPGKVVSGPPAPAMTGPEKVAMDPPGDAKPASNSSPLEQHKPKPLRLINPRETGGDIHYAVDGESFSLRPGEFHELPQDTAHRIEFHRGDEFGYAELELGAGDYVFGVGSKGWNLAPEMGQPDPSLRRAN